MSEQGGFAHGLREYPSIGYETAAAFRKDLVNALPESVKNAVKGVI